MRSTRLGPIVTPLETDLLDLRASEALENRQPIIYDISEVRASVALEACLAYILLCLCRLSYKATASSAGGSFVVVCMTLSDRQCMVYNLPEAIASVALKTRMT